MREMCRVLRPGGVLLVLEFSHIENPLLRTAYQGFQALWPAAGKALVERRRFLQIPGGVHSRASETERAETHDQ